MVVDYRVVPVGITRAKLAEKIAKQLKKFFEVRAPGPPALELRATYRLYSQMMESVDIDPTYAKYKVGPEGIKMRHIQIAALEQISRGGWQPHLIYVE